MTSALTFLLSLLVPGLGYFHSGNNKSFYTTITLFYSVVFLGAAFKLFTSFWGFIIVITALLSIYFFAAIHASYRVNSVSEISKKASFLKFFFTISFILITAISFGNRRTVMGFDIMSMDVPVMQPAVLQGDKFLVDTWAYKNGSPKRRDIIAHSFNRQQGLYLNRIIALEGDKIEIKGGAVLLNGKVLNETYVLSVHVRSPESKDMKAVVVPEGQYFVMGDNRDASFGDSRFSGLISIDNIEGKVTHILHSPDKRRIGITVK